LKITIFNGKIHYKWPFSIAMLVYQRVPPSKSWELLPWKGDRNSNSMRRGSEYHSRLVGTETVPKNQRPGDVPMG